MPITRPSGSGSSSTQAVETSGIMETQVESAGKAAMFQVVTHWSGWRLVPPHYLRKSQWREGEGWEGVRRTNMIVAVQLLAGVRGSMAVAADPG
mgnify:CR=1 FL=1